MSQLKEDIDGKDCDRPATGDKSDREQKSMNLDKIYNWGNQILVYIAGCAAVGGFVSDGITTSATIGAGLVCYS